ncbi:hypothetical protein L798_03828 [Zootermopsis nevadensis]|uniref:Uncharacterized protein n=1 Tax=Zootermopsis nevadensis TaxID=136037 RepID=A0A067QQN7_ZOONE|nr:hypothetical protein L798_03828 [Zootermopsis nevadensis]
MKQSDSSSNSVQRSSSNLVANVKTRPESDRTIAVATMCLLFVTIGNADVEAHRPRELAELTHPQCPSHVLNGIVLPNFFDCHKQNVVQFLQELDDYYRLKSVSESLKLSQRFGRAQLGLY